MATERPAKAKRILVVEDEPMICMLIEDCSANSATPSPPKPQASKRRWKRRRTPTSTLGSSTPISRASPPCRLPKPSFTRGTPFVFATGYGEVPEPYRGRPMLTKPFQMDGLKQMLQSAFG